MKNSLVRDLGKKGPFDKEKVANFRDTGPWVLAIGKERNIESNAF